MNIHHLPALRMLAIVMLGLLTGSLISISFLEVVIISLAAFSMTLILYYYLKKNTLLYYVNMFTTGLLLSTSVTIDQVPDVRKLLPEQTGWAKAEVIKVLNINENYVRVLVEGTLDTKGLPRLENERIILSISNPNPNYTIYPGMSLLIDGKFRLPKYAQLKEDFPERQYLKSMGARWFGRANGQNVKLSGFEKSFEYYRYIITSSLRKRIFELYPESVAGVALALLTGDKSSLAAYDKSNFSLTGTAHLLAVSGLHVGIIAMMIYAFVGFTYNKWIRFAFFSIFIILFIAMTGFMPSGVRAGLMVILAYFAMNVERDFETLNIFALAILISIISSPAIIFSVGFQMSFFSVLAIIIFYKVFYARLKKVLNTKKMGRQYLAASISVTLSASIGVAPVIAHYFGIFSIISPLANLIIVPLMSLGMVFSMFAVAFSYAFFPIGVIYASASQLMIESSQLIAGWLAGMRYSSISGDDALIISVIVSLALAYLITAKNWNQAAFRASFASVCILLAIQFISKPEPDYTIYPRSQFTALVEKNQRLGTNFYIVDRKPSQHPIRDYAFEQFIINYEDEITIWYCGNAGINLIDFVKHERQFEQRLLSLDQQRFIKDYYNLNYHLSQIIDYD